MPGPISINYYGICVTIFGPLYVARTVFEEEPELPPELEEPDGFDEFEHEKMLNNINKTAK